MNTFAAKLTPRPSIHADLLASSNGRVSIQQAPAAGALPGIASVIAAAARGSLPGHRNAGARILALASAEAAVAMVLCRIFSLIDARGHVSDENLDAIDDDADAIRAAGDFAAAGNDPRASSWYALARRLNAEGFMGLAKAQHNGHRVLTSGGFNMNDITEARFADLLDRVSDDEAAERLHQSRVDWLASVGSDEEPAASRRFWEALEAVR